MFRISAFYANDDGAHFDFNYYRNDHFSMVLRLLKPYGAMRFEVDRGLATKNGAPVEFIAIGHLFVDSLETLSQGMAIHGAEILSDIKNYTNLTPRVQCSEML